MCIYFQKKLVNWGGLLFISMSIYNDSDESNGNKLRTYRTYKTSLNTKYHVKLNIYKSVLPTHFVRFKRSCNLPLTIETGRFTVN